MVTGRIAMLVAAGPVLTAVGEEGRNRVSLEVAGRNRVSLEVASGVWGCEVKDGVMGREERVVAREEGVGARGEEGMAMGGVVAREEEVGGMVAREKGVVARGEVMAKVEGSEGIMLSSSPDPLPIPSETPNIKRLHPHRGTHITRSMAATKHQKIYAVQ